MVDAAIVRLDPAPNTSPHQQDASRSHTQYSCVVCGRVFDRKDTASRHAQIHDKRRSMMASRRKACVQCCKSKIRCSSEKPSCSSCLRRNIPCIYEARRSQYDETRAPEKNNQHTQQASGGAPKDDDPRKSMGAASLSSPSRAWGSNQSTNASLSGSDHMPVANASERLFGMYSNPDFVDLNIQNFDCGSLLGLEFDSNDNFGTSLQLEEMGLFQQMVDTVPESNSQAQTRIPTPKDPEPSDGFFGPKEKSVADCLPTPKHRDLPSPEDPWPMDLHAGPAPRLVLPSLRVAGGCYSGKHFSTPELNAETWTALQRGVELPSEQILWPPLNVDNFPDKETIDHCIDLFFAHVHQAEKNRFFVRTESYLTAQLLQILQGYTSGNEHLFEMSESSRSSVVHNAKCMGLFQDDVTPQSPPVGALEESWREWIRRERLRRLGWAVYELDSAVAYLHNGRHHLNIADATMILPSSMDDWDAESAYAWSTLQPWNTPLASTGLRIRPLLRSLLEEDGCPADIVSNERHWLILVMALGRIMWSLNDASVCPIDQAARNSVASTRDRTLRILDGFTQYPTALRNTDTKRKVARAVHATHLVHMTHVYGTGDLMALFFPFLRHVLQRRTAEGARIKSQLNQWAAKNPQKVRAVAYHCAQVLALVRQFPENSCIEPFNVFHSGLLLMVMAQLMPPTRADQNQGQSLRIDHLGTPDDPVCKSISNWVENGGAEVICVHGVPVLCSRQGSRHLLDETVESLQRIKVWGISQNLFHMLLKISDDNLDFN
ncbi:hypothetical protein NW759_016533 [Fusarium solani]|nr:hypothetical protein NW759_016533 [Fusarium solani]